MEIKEKCPECGSNHMGRGKWDGYAVLRPADKTFSLGSRVDVELCTDCGLILKMRVRKPEKFKR